MTYKGTGHVYLTGFMGTGKSTVGHVLARRLHRPFVDLDVEIFKRTGKTIPQLFAKGEEVFRAEETKALRAVVDGAPSVVALGGGALLRAENRELVASSGTLVRLTCLESVLWERLKPQIKGRPLLAGPGGRRRLRELIAARRRVPIKPKFSISTTHRSPFEVALAVADRLLS